MTLQKNKEELMRIVDRNDNTLAKLLDILKNVSDLGKPFENYIKKVMVAKQCLKTHILHKEGSITERAYYVSYGFILAYYFTKSGNLRVVKILGPGSIVAGHGFLNHKKSKYNLMVFKDTYVLEITYEQMQSGYVEVPGMQELAMLTKEGFEDEELAQDEVLSKSAEERVIDFYTKYPMLIPPGAMIKDLFVASLLRISPDHLRHIRASLIKKGLLPLKK